MNVFPDSGGTAAWPTADPSPAVDRVRLYGAEFQQDPSAVYRRLRQQYGPVAPVLLEGDLPAWFVCGYQELQQVTGDAQLFARDTRRWNGWGQVPEGWTLLPYLTHNPSIMGCEGERHRRRGTVLSDALAAVDQFDLRSWSERVADQLIDEFTQDGHADLVEQYALSIPMAVLGRIFGMAEHDIPELIRDVKISLGSGPSSLTAHQRILAAMAKLVAVKRARPGEDVPSWMLRHPDAPTDEEIAHDLLLIVVAAQPVTNWIGTAVRLMLTDSRFAATLSGGRGSVGQALTMVLWHDTPTQNFIGRFATRDTEFGGRHIRAGDVLVLGLAAANTDPAVAPDLEADAAGNQAHLSFSHGEHGCPYPAPEMSEIIAATSVEVLLDRLPDLRLAVPVESLRWQPSIWMRGLEQLPVAFTPAPRHSRIDYAVPSEPW